MNNHFCIVVRNTIYHSFKGQKSRKCWIVTPKLFSERLNLMCLFDICTFDSSTKMCSAYLMNNVQMKKDCLTDSIKSSNWLPLKIEQGSTVIDIFLITANMRNCIQTIHFISVGWWCSLNLLSKWQIYRPSALYL